MYKQRNKESDLSPRIVCAVGLSSGPNDGPSWSSRRISRKYLKLIIIFHIIQSVASHRCNKAPLCEHVLVIAWHEVSANTQDIEVMPIS